jgi:hypothetical protein
VATCSDYAELIQAFRAWYLDGMRSTFATIDAVAGLPIGYCEKICRPLPARRFGPISLGPLLGAGGLKIQLVVDEEALERIRRHSAFKEHSPNAPYSRQYASRSMRPERKRNRFITRANSQILNARRLLVTTPAQRRNWARAAAAKRWART